MEHIAPRQLHPLEVDPRTGEPFLTLPSPWHNIILTPPRVDDVPSMIRNLNDPKVYKTLQGPPHPYRDEHAVWWINNVKTKSDAVLQELIEAEQDPSSPLRVVSGCPVRTLREVQADGTDIFLGDVDIHRCGYPDVKDQDERKRLCEANEAFSVGDERIHWCFGDYLAGSHHGRGIMSAAIQALVTQWMIPRMNAHHIRCETYVGNRGSVRVFEKCGFTMEETVDVEFTVPCGEKQSGYHVLLWHRGQQVGSAA